MRAMTSEPCVEPHQQISSPRPRRSDRIEWKEKAVPVSHPVGPTEWTTLSRAAAAMMLVLGALLIASCSATSPAGSDQAQERLSTGREIFATNCTACHGTGGEGQPDWHIRKEDGTLPAPPLNGDGHTWHHGDGLLYRTVSQGGVIFEDPTYTYFKSGMPAFGDALSHEEILAVLTYVKSLWGEKTKLGNSITASQQLISEQDPFPKEGEIK